MVDRPQTNSHTLADYISELTAELAQLAAAEHHTDLACILEMARLESDRLCGCNAETKQEPAADNVIFLPSRTH